MDKRDKRRVTAEEEEDVPRYTIGVVAEMTGLHQQTLRTYEEEGLITPHRSKGNTRYYSERDIKRIRSILNLTRDLGVNMVGVEIILRMRDEIERLKSQLALLAKRFESEMRSELGEESAEKVADRETSSPLAAIVPVEKSKGITPAQKRKREGGQER